MVAFGHLFLLFPFQFVLTQLACYTYSMVVIPLYDTLGPEACTYIIGQGMLKDVLESLLIEITVVNISFEMSVILHTDMGGLSDCAHEIFLQYFLEILKLTLENFEETLKNTSSVVLKQ